MLWRTIAVCSIGLRPFTAAIACDGRTVEDSAIYGVPLCVPTAPTRVLVLDQAVSLGAALDVGLPVVGAPLDLMGDEALRERALQYGVESIGVVVEPNLERMVALQPDLIIGYVGNSALAAGLYPQLSQIAPTMLEVSADWRNYYMILAAMTGAEDRIADEFAAYDARVADVRARMPDTTVSIVRITSWDFQVYLDYPGAYAPFAVASEAGLRRTDYETTDEPEPGMRRPDWEELGELDGEILLYIVGGTNDSDVSGRHEEVIDNPLWQMLPAVQAGRVHRVDHGTWMEFSGLASAHSVLDDLERFVIGTE